MDKVSYALGLGIGRQLSQMGATEIVADDFAQAIKDVVSGAELKISDSEAQTIVNKFFEEKQAAQAGAAKSEGENFLALTMMAMKLRPKTNKTRDAQQVSEPSK